MVCGWPVRIPNWLKIASRMTANATHKRICLVKSFKFHLRPQSYYDKRARPAFPFPSDIGNGSSNLHHPKLPRQQIDLGASGS